MTRNTTIARIFAVLYERLRHFFSYKTRHRIINTASTENNLGIVSEFFSLYAIDNTGLRLYNDHRHSPGVNFKKFHFVPAALKTSLVSICIISNRTDNSFMKPILISRWVFSITFAASATLILGRTVNTCFYDAVNTRPLLSREILHPRLRRF